VVVFSVRTTLSHAPFSSPSPPHLICGCVLIAQQQAVVAFLFRFWGLLILHPGMRFGHSQRDFHAVPIKQLKICHRLSGQDGQGVFGSRRRRCQLFN